MSKRFHFKCSLRALAFQNSYQATRRLFRKFAFIYLFIFEFVSGHRDGSTRRATPHGTSGPGFSLFDLWLRAGAEARRCWRRCGGRRVCAVCAVCASWPTSRNVPQRPENVVFSFSSLSSLSFLSYNGVSFSHRRFERTASARG